MRRGLMGLLVAATAPLWLAGTAGADTTDATGPPDATIEFTGTCDASAVVFTLGGSLLVADDEVDVLFTYRPDGGRPVARHDLYPHTGTPKRARRNTSAFEGAARLGDKIYFITSHAREEKGKNRPNRRRLIALKSTRIGMAEQVEPVGIAYTNLKARLSEAPEMRSVALGSSIMEVHRQLPHLAPDRQGLNIEGLAAGKDGVSLLMGLRNPRRDEEAVVVPLLNPERVVLGMADARFDQPIRLDLGGHGIASLALDPATGVYYIVAAPHDASGGNRLYRWSGDPADAPVLVTDVLPADFDAQALAIDPAGGAAIVLSDDGTRRIAVEKPAQCERKPDAAGTCQCNELKDPALKRFRGRRLALPEVASAKP